jgi:hypothetical protein
VLEAEEVVECSPIAGHKRAPAERHDVGRIAGRKGLLFCLFLFPYSLLLHPLVSTHVSWAGGAVRTSESGLNDLEAANVTAGLVGVALVALVGAGLGCRAHVGRLGVCICVWCVSVVWSGVEKPKVFFFFFSGKTPR